MRTVRLRRVLQVGAFVRKEITDVAHQPRLLLSLVLAPFLILLAFGAGYRTEVRPYRAYLVDPTGRVFLERVREDEAQLGRFIRIVGDGSDEAEARRLLGRGDVDVVVIFPADPLDTVMSGQQAPITVLHNRIDPIEQTAIDFASRLAVDVVNGRILAGVVTSGQQAAAPLGEPLRPTTEALGAADVALASGDRAEAERHLTTVDDQLTALRAGLGVTAALMSQFEASDPAAPAADGTAPAGGAVPAGEASDAVGRELDEAARGVDAVRADLDAGDDEAARRRLQAVSGTVVGLEERWEQLTTVQADVLVRPFVTRIANVTPGRGVVSDFYVPAAVMLLVQQFGVAFGALSFVREKALGILEVFRVAPVGGFETVLGRYLGYTIVGGVVSAGLLALVHGVLRVPMAGRWQDVAVAVGLTLVASIGLGLLMSLVAPTDTQAVQYTMITLLASLFFSGFFLAVEQLTYPIRTLSWLLPSTYGSRLLRDVTLRGLTLDRPVALGLAAHILVVGTLTVVGARRRLAGDR